MQRFTHTSSYEGGASSGTKSIKPLKICLLGYRSKPHCGGQGIYIKYLSSALAKLGHNVAVISGEPYPELEEGVRLIKMPGLNIFEKESRVFALSVKDLGSYTDIFEWFSVLTGGFPEPYTFGRRIAKYFKKHLNDYDLIHDNQSLCYGLLKLQKMGLPVTATIHHPITKDKEIALSSAGGFWHRLLIRRWHTFLRMQKRVVQRLDHVLTVSEQSRQDITEAFEIDRSRISLVYNGIDTDAFAPMPEIRRKPHQLMATASADMPLKGLDYLLEALANLAERYADLKLLVIGSPNSGGHTEKLIKRLGIESRITFVSNLKTSEIRQYYAEATMAVIPSLYEGFGLPAGEAMSCGTPVISSDGGALPEIVGDAGLIVPAGNANALTEAISDLLQNPEKRDRLGEAGRKRILESFSWEVTAREMTRYYMEVLEKC